MSIPKHLLYEGITEEGKRRLERRVAEAREKLKDAPAFSSKEEAIRAAAKLYNEENDIPIICKDPEDAGSEYVVIPSYVMRKYAEIGGYTIAVKEQEIADRANGRTSGSEEIDEIEEV